MARQRSIILSVVLSVIIGGLFITEQAWAACLQYYCYKNSYGGQTCVCTKTGSNDTYEYTTGQGQLCDPKTKICTGAMIAAIGGTVGQSYSCDPTNPTFPTEADQCGVKGVAFCINHGGNASKAQGQPFTLNAVLQGADAIDSCTKNGKCTGFIPLDATSDQVVCQNPNWELVTFSAYEFKLKAGFCSTSWDITSDPAVCINNGTTEVRTLFCKIDPGLVTVTGGQEIPCTLIPGQLP